MTRQKTKKNKKNPKKQKTNNKPNKKTKTKKQKNKQRNKIKTNKNKQTNKQTNKHIHTQKEVGKAKKTDGSEIRKNSLNKWKDMCGAPKYICTYMLYIYLYIPRGNHGEYKYRIVLTYGFRSRILECH